MPCPEAAQRLSGRTAGGRRRCGVSAQAAAGIRRPMNVRIGLAQHRIGPDMEENLRQAQRAVLACAGPVRSRAAAKSGSICARWRVRQVCIFWAAVCRNLMHRAVSITPAFSFPLQARNLHATGNVICLTSHCRADCAYRKAAFLHPASSCGLWNLPSGRSALPSASIFAFRSNFVRLLTAARSWCWFQQRSTRPQDRRIGRSTAAAARWTIRCFSALVRLRLRRMARIPITAIPWR